MVKLANWKLNKTMTIWGIAFGVAATLSGIFILNALDGGFVAEGFFLLVISWIFYIVLVARIVMRLTKKQEHDEL